VTAKAHDYVYDMLCVGLLHGTKRPTDSQSESPRPLGKEKARV